MKISKLYLLSIEDYQNLCKIYLDEYPNMYSKIADYELDNLIFRLYCNPYKHFIDRFFKRK